MLNSLEEFPASPISHVVYNAYNDIISSKGATLGTGLLNGCLMVVETA